MAIKEYSTLPRSPGQEPHHQMQFSAPYVEGREQKTESLLKVFLTFIYLMRLKKDDMFIIQLSYLLGLFVQRVSWNMIFFVPTFKQMQKISLSPNQIYSVWKQN